MKIDEITMEWKGFGNGFGKWDSKCRLRVYEHEGIWVCVFSEMPDNKGTSVTNCAESLAMMAMKKYEIPPNKYVHVEHYPAETGFSPIGKKPENFSSIAFTVMSQKNRLDPTGRTSTSVLVQPVWSPLQKEHVESLIGEALDA